MSQTVSECPLCACPDSAVFDQREVHGQAVTNRVCARCGLVYQSPRMDAAELEAFYAQEYRALYQGEAGPTQKDLVVQAGRAESLLHFAKARIPPPASHLDIGCSSGALLIRFQRHFDCQAFGIEPGGAYRDYALTRGLTVYPSLEDLSGEVTQRFDLASLAHVLEHLPQPVEYLAELRKQFLEPSGWLLLEVPNLYAHNSFEVAHLISFSPHTLTQTLKKAGFEPVALQAHGQPRSVVLPLYLTTLARPVPNSTAEGTFTVRPERGVALKRRAGMLRKQILQRLFPDLAWLPFP